MRFFRRVTQRVATPVLAVASVLLFATCDFDKISGFGSKGTSGVTVVMADGSVRVISSNINPAVFRALCTIHGAEKIDLATDAPLSTDK